MDQPAATTAEASPAQAPDDGGKPDEAPKPDAPQTAGTDEKVKGPGFRTRGGARRRARFLRKARELAYRDLGGLVFDLHRFGQRNDPLVLAKLTTLGQIDAELRAIEAVLEEDRPVTVLREAGITACPRCTAIHSGEDHFCPRCGFSSDRNVDLPVGGPAVPGAGQIPAPPATQAPASQAPATAVHSPITVAHPTGAAGAPQPSSGDEPTEILRPPASGK